MVHALLDRPSPVCPAPGSGAAGPDDPGRDRRRRFDLARQVLEDARGVLERGWLQHGWYLTDRPRPRSLLARLGQPERPPGIDEVRQACLVAAVVVAAHGGRGGRGPDVLADAGPALDLVWDALWETRGHSGPPVAGRAAAPPIRAARMRDLVRWNDATDRRREDVLGLLDRAISRGMLGALGAPAELGPPTQPPARTSAAR